MLYKSDRRKNWKIWKRRQTRISTLIFIYTIHFAYLKVYTKFHNPKSSCCWEISDEKYLMCYIGVTEGKTEKEAKWALASLFSFTQCYKPTWRCTQNMKTLAPIGTQKFATEIFIGENEKWINRWTDKQYVAVLLLHNTTYHYQALYQISES